MLRPLLRRPLAHATFSCLQLFFRDVDELQKAGINAADLAKLKAAGICTVKGVQMCTRKMLLNIKGISEAKVDKIKEAAAKLVDAGFITAMEYSARREKVIRITTGSAELDKLLGGAARRARVGHLLHVQADRATAAFFPFRMSAQAVSRRKRSPRSLASSAPARRRSATRSASPPSSRSAWAAPTARSDPTQAADGEFNVEY